MREKRLSYGMSQRTERVLVIDDEDTVLDVCEEMLKKMGCRVLLAKSGREALDLYKKHRDEIDIVMLDMIMPQMSGRRTYDKLKEINPSIKVLLWSGYSIDGMATEILECGCDGFIQKPFSVEQLHVKIGEIMDGQ